MEHLHIVGRFDRDLAKIKSNVVKMGQLVRSQLEKAMQALDDPDSVAIAALVAKDRKVNGMNRSISDRSERLIALRQPMAQDLRQALSPINIASELERIGDHAKSTAKRAGKLRSTEIPEPFRHLLDEISAMIFDQIKDVLIAYENSDLELAAKVREKDLDIDALNKQVFNLSVEALSESQGNAETLMNVVLISRGLERVGDHVVNIARFVHQIETGDDLKATE